MDEHKPPAYDENGNGCWNVWVDDRLPESFPSYAEAWQYADARAEDGHNVYTDFD